MYRTAVAVALALCLTAESLADTSGLQVRSVEVLGRYWKITSLYGLSQRYTEGACQKDLIKVLNERKVKYKLCTTSDLKFLLTYVRDRKYGAAVSGKGHMLNLVHIELDGVDILTYRLRSKGKYVTKNLTHYRGRVVVLDNADSRLRPQEWTLQNL